MPIPDAPRYSVTDEIAELLRVAAARQRISRADIAEQLGVSPATVSDIMNAKVATSGVLLELCALVGVSRYDALPLTATERRWLRALEAFAEVRSGDRLLSLIEDLEVRAATEAKMAEAAKRESSAEVIRLHRHRRRQTK